MLAEGQKSGELGLVRVGMGRAAGFRVGCRVGLLPLLKNIF